MKRSPLILVSPCTQRHGAEFADASISLANRYTDALIAGGALPQILPATTSRTVIAEAVSRCDGVLITGGDDVDPNLYNPGMPEELKKLAGPLEPERDVWEKELIAEVFAQGKPLLCVCRGIQILNVALGGTLFVDIATQLPGALNHRQLEKKAEIVHDVEVEPGSRLAQLAGTTKFGVNSTHHQALENVAPSLRIVAKSSDGIVEAVELKNPANKPFVLGVQFHPERLIDRNPVFKHLFDGFVDACARWRERNL